MLRQTAASLRRLSRSAAVLLLVACLYGCGFSPSRSAAPTPLISVIVSPSSATVQGGQTAQLVATVAGTPNQQVSWSVNGVAGGNLVLGTVTTAGLYKAPDVVPTPNTVTVTAASAAEPQRLANVSITIRSMAAPLAGCDWNPVRGGGPLGGGGRTYYLKLIPGSPDTLYSQDGKVRKSTDDGATWTEINVWQGALIGNTGATFYWTGQVGNGYKPDGSLRYLTVLYRSIDAGQSNTEQSSFTVSNVFLDARNDSVLYRQETDGTNSGQLYRSSDSGRTWQKLSASPLARITHLEVALTSPTTMYAATMDGLAVFTSRDEGVTWIQAPIATPATGLCSKYFNWRLAVNSATPSEALAAGTNVMFHTVDSGAHWTSVNFPGSAWGGVQCVQQLISSPVSPGAFYARVDPFVSGSNSGPVLGPQIYRTTDGGSTWQPASSGITVGEWLYDVAVSRSEAMFTSSEYGFYKSSPGAASWMKTTTGFLRPTTPEFRQTVWNPLPGQPVGVYITHPFAYTPDFSWLYFAAGNYGLWSNDGKTWKPSTLEHVYAVAVDPSNGHHLLALMQNGTFGDAVPLLNGSPDALSASALFIVESTDGGSSWVKVGASPSLGSFAGNAAIAFSPAAQGLVLACGPAGFARSTDNGTRWQMSSGTNACLPFRTSRFLFDPLNADNVLLAPYVSTDAGVSWTEIKAPKSLCDSCTLNAVAIDFWSNAVYLGRDVGDDRAISAFYKSVDGSATWIPLEVFPLMIAPGEDCGYGGVWPPPPCEPYPSLRQSYPLIVVDALSPNAIYMSDGFRIAASSDSGMTWAWLRGYPYLYINRSPDITDLWVMPGTNDIFAEFNSWLQMYNNPRAPVGACPVEPGVR